MTFQGVEAIQLQSTKTVMVDVYFPARHRGSPKLVKITHTFFVIKDLGDAMLVGGDMVGAAHINVDRSRAIFRNCDDARAVIRAIGQGW